MKKYHFVKQEGAKDCGVACLEMIIESYGGYYNLDFLKTLTKTTKKGVRAFDLLEAGRKIGFKAEGFKIPLDQLKNCHLPCILFVKKNNLYGHYIVLYKVLKKGFLIADPASRLKKVSYKELQDIYQNVVLSLIPIKKINSQQKTKIYPFIKKYLITYRKNLVSLFLFSTMYIIITLLLSIIVPYLLKDLTLFFKLSILIMILFILKFIFLNKRNTILYKLESNMNLKLNQDIFSNTINLPYLYFYNHSKGDILTRINEASYLGNFLTMLFSNILVYGLFGIMAFTLLFIINYYIGLLLFIYILFYLAFYLKKALKLNDKIIDIKEVYSDKENFIYECLNAYDTLKGCKMENDMISIFSQKEKEYQSYLKKLGHLENKIIISQEIFKNLYLFTFFIVAYYLLKNGYKVNILLTCYILGEHIKDVLINILNTTQEYLQNKWSIKRILEVIKTFKVTKQLKLKKFDKIQFKNLTFTYPLSEKTTLKNFSFTIHKGDKILLYGPSGVGKSTLLRIILKDLKISDDTCYINGIDINKYGNIKNKIGYIPPNSFLFTGTLRFNLVGLKKIEDEKLKQIMEICQIKKPNLDDLIEENGANLSSGEKQRIVLGLALLNNFDVLLIDEGLCKINSELERQILKNIFKTYPNMTLIVVSHRLENKDLFDYVKKIERMS